MTAKRATVLLGARGIASAKCTVVLDPYIACQFLELLAPSFTGENVLKNKSMYAQNLGQKIAAKGVKIMDDGTISAALGSSSFDGEGTASKKTEIVSDGILAAIFTMLNRLPSRSRIDRQCRTLLLQNSAPPLYK